LDEVFPTSSLACAAIEKATGTRPESIRRFKTGTSHYVFEATWPDRASLVVRMGSSRQVDRLREGAWLASQLRPLGVPLPKLLHEGLDDVCPWIILERVPGVDLGAIINDLSEDQLAKIASHVAAAQLASSRFGVPTGFGYAARLDAAPHRTWSAVLDDLIKRSRRRIAAAGLFDLTAVSMVETLVDASRAALDAVAATPFLHDTTTKNVMITPDGAFSGIVDVDDLCFGDPRFAPALTLAVLLGYGGPAHYVNAWMNQASFRDDHLFQIYVAVFLIDLMAELGQSFNGNEPPATEVDRTGLNKAFLTHVEQFSPNRKNRNAGSAASL